MHTNRVWSLLVLALVMFMCACCYVFFEQQHALFRSLQSRFSNQSALISETKLEKREQLSATFDYSLDTTCQSNSTDASARAREAEFNDIFQSGRWGDKESRSGGGSTLKGAFDWIVHLRSLVQTYSIRSIADIPCGDTYWQFSIKEINTIKELYFGGDISTHVIESNRKFYQSAHKNKLFQYWDLVQCPLPTFTYRNLTQESKGKIDARSVTVEKYRFVMAHMNKSSSFLCRQSIRFSYCS
jgi:hypothetical protein